MKNLMTKRSVGTILLVVVVALEVWASAVVPDVFSHLDYYSSPLGYLFLCVSMLFLFGGLLLPCPKILKCLMWCALAVMLVRNALYNDLDGPYTWMLMGDNEFFPELSISSIWGHNWRLWWCAHIINWTLLQAIVLAFFNMIGYAFYKGCQSTANFYDQIDRRCK